MGFIKSVAAAFAALSVVDAAQLLGASSKDIIPNSYIVVMKDSVSSTEFDSHVSGVTNLHHEHLSKRGSTNFGGLKHMYSINGWQGYSGSFSRDTINEILKDDNVDYVEHDRRAKILGWASQPNAPSWGLGRVSHRERGNSTLVYDEMAGEGITFYGVDTGIDITHPDFGGRGVLGTNVVGGAHLDGHGHGTHTAGTVAGNAYGIAKKASIVSVKVLNNRGSGSWSGIIAGLNWCVTHARENNVLGKAVMNLSIGGGRMTSVNQAATNAANAGIFLAVAAGNCNTDARNISPASAENVCTVAASTEFDRKASFSNYGATIEIYAPGNNIISTVPGNRSRAMSGTSMAAPHVAGVAAAIMASQNIAPSEVCAHLAGMAEGKITNPGRSTTNKLLYNGSGE
ncbi:conserved hypothetical protein [Uncinocarpus reesii 1704]|uniref:Uncharacterized protein n=1 Tax=Uncinocarpus reesii (strain UAMH 1704) TaxID=336963 RepID=C4JQ48_UNCRE|nr:uncharacterized protein UREG_03281 [Uncinocarpus reesii 1704]EEP78435.1 conserved hypothetical protein [Uncinocarpus reesii 1704]